MKQFVEGLALAFVGLFGTVLILPFGCISGEKAQEAAGAGAQAAGEALAGGSGWLGALVVGAVAAAGTLLGVKMATGRGKDKPGARDPAGGAP